MDPRTLSVDDLGAEPYTALNYHLGMMLGVADMQTEQAYHRGKVRLHNAWLHRPGVIWGYPITVQAGEIHVAAGLATDGAGRELYLDREMRLDLPAWFDARRGEAAAGQGDLDFVAAAEAGKEVVAAVVVQYRACPTREVPALADAGERPTAPSRVRDEVELLLVAGDPGRPDPLPTGFRRLRLLLGLDRAPNLPGAQGPPASAWLTEAQEVVRLAAALPGMKVPDRILRIQELAARDSAELTPHKDVGSAQRSGAPSIDGAHHFPSTGGVVLGAVRGLRIRIIKDDDAHDRVQIDGDPAVDLAVRPVHLPTPLLHLLLASVTLPREG